MIDLALHSYFTQDFRKWWKLSWHPVMKLWMAVIPHRFHHLNPIPSVGPECISESRNYSPASCHLIPWASRANCLFGNPFQYRTQINQGTTAAMLPVGWKFHCVQTLIPERLWKALRRGISPSFRHPQISVSKTATPHQAGEEEEVLPTCNV